MNFLKFSNENHLIETYKDKKAKFSLYLNLYHAMNIFLGGKLRFL